jgi:hypothetical protein
MAKLAKEFGFSDVGLRKTCVSEAKHSSDIEKNEFREARQKDPSWAAREGRERPRLGPGL